MLSLDGNVNEAMYWLTIARTRGANAYEMQTDGKESFRWYVRRRSRQKPEAMAIGIKLFYTLKVAWKLYANVYW